MHSLRILCKADLAGNTLGLFIICFNRKFCAQQIGILTWDLFYCQSKDSNFKRGAASQWAAIRVPVPAGCSRKSCSSSGLSRFKLKLSSVDILLRCKQTILNNQEIKIVLPVCIVLYFSGWLVTMG